MPFVSRILLYPIKGLPPVRVKAARVLASGALDLDRRWAFVDSQDRFINGKNTPEIHAVRAEYDLDRGEVGLDGLSFSLTRQPRELEQWFSRRLNQPVELRVNEESGFPDDTTSPGPTMVAESSLALVARWFDFSIDETRLRFRTNIEIGGTEALWEDRLYGCRLQLGDVRVDAINPCARCVVPSRNPVGGQAFAGFQKRFSDLRREHLSPEVGPAPFDHFYRFAVNTRIPSSESGKAVREGDEVLLSGVKRLTIAD
jgi:uncharacterized protein YcbX